MNAVPVARAVWQDWLLWLCAIAILHGSAQNSCFGDETSQPFEPEIVAASDQAEKAIAGFSLNEQLDVQLFAAEPMLANPIAFCVDSKGRFFVTESFRYGNNPGATNMQEDLACRNVEDRIAMHHRKHGEQVADYTQKHERVRLLEDTDGDGKADRSTIFADGFHSLETGSAAGVLALGNGIILTVIPDLWYLEDTNGDGHADLRKSLSNGYGVHAGFRGHDMHGPMLYVDGRLYWTMGDRGLHVETATGVISSPDRGAVLRCNRDGTDLEIYHTGLRNPQDLTYDEYGNLFTGDNNSDGGDRARIVHVLEGGDSGWNIGFQYMGDKEYLRGPWNAERLWHLPFQNQAAWIVPPIAHLGNGPAGVDFYPGTGLGDRYGGYMFMCDYNGSPAGTGVYAFKLQPRGGSFETVDTHKFLWGLSCSDVTFGHDGLYVSDWAASWNSANKGRLYRVYDPDPVAEKLAKATKELLFAGMEHRSNEELADLLAHRDRRVRLAAQLELVERGDAGRSRLLAVARESNHPLARLHAIWGLGIAGRADASLIAPLLPLLADPDAEVRAQTAKVVGDARYREATEPMLPLLKDPSPHVRMLAATAIGKLENPQVIEPLLEMLRANADRDPYLRHAAVMGLVYLKNPDALISHIDDSNRSARLGVLLALRRLEDERIATFLHDEDEQLVIEAARAIHDLPIAGASEQLASLIEPSAQSGKEPSQTLAANEPLWRRILNANFRLGRQQDARNLVGYLANSSNPDSLRREAAKLLTNWETPGQLDRVLNLYRPLPQRDLNVVRKLIETNIAALLQNASSAIKTDLIHLLQQAEIAAGNDVLVRWVDDGNESSVTRIAAMQLLTERKDPRSQKIIENGLEDKDPHLRIAAGRILAQRHPRRAAMLLVPIVQRSTSQAERQQTLATLGTLSEPRVATALAGWLDQLCEGRFPEDLHLDLIEAAKRQNDPEVADKLAAYRNTFSPDDALSAYRAALHGGDYDRGRDLFIGRGEVRCLRCHAVKNVGGTAGPPLSRVGVEQTREHLLESIVLPSAKITKGYETTVITTDEGRVISGIVQSEDDKWLQLLTPERQKIDIAVETIEDRFGGKSAMPDDMQKHLDAFDLRDLVEFLSHLGNRPQDRQTPPQENKAEADKTK